MGTIWHKRLGQIILLMVIFLFSGGMLYHDGLRIHCPFCISGISNIEKLPGEKITIVIDHESFELLLEKAVEAVTSNNEKVFSGRAPPLAI
jgi:hypothetical protein